jgi:uncharacterized protein (DUF1501 family)
VRGREVYGAFGPDAELGDRCRQRPADSDDSVEQYAMTLASWMGVDNGMLPTILPNLPNFPQANLGFMN